MKIQTVFICTDCPESNGLNEHVNQIFISPL